LRLTVLHLAVAWGKSDFVDILLDNKADPTIADTGDEGNTPLHLCAFSRTRISDRKKIAHSLLDRKASIDCENRKGISPLRLSGENGNWLQKLLGERAKAAEVIKPTKAMKVIKPMGKTMKTMKSARTSRSSKTRSRG